MSRSRVAPPTLCRSGVEPPTGTIHPRESRGTTDRKQESIKGFVSGECLSGFGVSGDIWRGWSFPVLAGRGLNPRPERSTHAKAGEQQTENRSQSKDLFRGNVFPDLELWGIFGGGGAFRSGVQPPTGSRLGVQHPNRRRQLSFLLRRKFEKFSHRHSYCCSRQGRGQP